MNNEAQKKRAEQQILAAKAYFKTDDFNFNVDPAEFFAGAEWADANPADANLNQDEVRRTNIKYAKALQRIDDIVNGVEMNEATPENLAFALGQISIIVEKI